MNDFTCSKLPEQLQIPKHQTVEAMLVYKGAYVYLI